MARAKTASKSVDIPLIAVPDGQTARYEPTTALPPVDFVAPPAPASEPVVKRNHFIRRNSGDVFSYTDIESNDFSLHDTAHSLSRINRFLGSTIGKYPYSVAQHSCLVADYLVQHVDYLAGFCGLLHDAHEAFFGDIPTPTKKFLLDCGVDINEVLAKPIDEWIYKQIGITLPLPSYVQEAVDAADFILYQNEGRTLMRNFVSSKQPDEWPPYTSTIVPWTHDESYRQFIARYNRLLPMARVQWRSQ